MPFVRIRRIDVCFGAPRRRRPASATSAALPAAIRLMVAASLCGILGIATAGAESARYASFRNYIVYGTPVDVAIADVNHDAVPDVIVPTYAGISVFLGRVAAPLYGPIQLNPSSTLSVAVADFNGDTHPDIAADVGSSQIWIFFGRGNGSFEGGRILPYFCDSCTLAAADLNSDGHADLGVASLFGITMLLGDGTGGFVQSPAAFSASFTTSIAAGDVDSDGKPDLVVTAFGANTVIVLSNLGLGLFSRADYPVGDTPFKAVLADFNGDQRLDLAVNDRDSEQVYVLQNTGSGHFGPAVPYAAGCTPYVPQGCSLRGLAATDVNGDGLQDLLTPGSIVFGKGNGTFHAPRIFPAGNYPSYVAAARFAPDGVVHFVVGNTSGMNISVVPAVKPAVPRSLSTGARPVFTVDGDFNGDGKRDLASAAEDAGEVAIYLGNGDGTFVRGTDLAAAAAAAIVREDFNGDGKADLAVGGVQGTSIFLGNGDGTFTRAASYATFYGDCTANAFESTPAACLAFGDINGDGIGDLVGANWIAQTVLTRFGNGDGTFRSGPSFTTSSVPFHLTLADFDRDGKLDLAIPQFASGVFVYRGAGDGTFGPGSQLLPSATPYAAAAADINEDGNPDLVVAGGASSSTVSRAVSFLAGNGDGTFGPPTTLTADLNPVSVAIADVNNDGHLDIVSANYEGYDFSVIPGDGAGGFFPQLLYGAGQAPAHVVLADVNADGRLDVVTTNHFSDNLTIALHVPY